MKLTKEHIEVINGFLVKNEVVFDDIRHEVIDHIASDIEQNFENENFSEALKTVLKKWESQIKLSESIWVTTWASFPVIILSKLKKLMMPLALIFITVLFLSNLFLDFSDGIVSFYYENKKTLILIYIFWLALVLFFGFKLFFSKGYTTYKYVSKRIYYTIGMSTIIVFSASSINILLLSFLLVNLISSIFLFQNYKAHFRFLKLNFY
jgi:hypothetical protein